MVEEKTKVISVGGSIIIPSEGFNKKFIQQFKNLIINRVKNGEKFILVIGGGSTARLYQGGLKDLGITTTETLDWIGIQATILNAHFIKHLFGDYAHPEVVVDPRKRIKTKKPIIIGAGWKPGCSTDYDATLLAQTYNATELINASNIDYIYSADPKNNSSATIIKTMTWKQLRAVVGDRWNPGANLPFDPIAAKLGEKLKLKLSFVKGTDLQELSNVLDGKEFQGTVVA